MAIIKYIINIKNIKIYEFLLCKNADFDTFKFNNFYNNAQSILKKTQ